MDVLSDDYDYKEILVWPNGHKPQDTFYCKVTEYINSLKRLKDLILQHMRLNIKTDKIKIYNYNQIEIDNSDIEELVDKSILFVALNGESFNMHNYLREYEFVNLLKSGGYGEVYSAKHVITGKEVAIKKINVSKLRPEEIYNISREAGYMEKLVHTHVVKLFNYFNYKNDSYFVMDYAKGGDLSSYLKQHKMLPEQRAKEIFIQIYEAVRYIHSKNIVHRDLKPLNILFLDEEQMHIILIDFGISGVSKDNLKENIKCGTAMFMPPELASGKTFESNFKIDIWALGVILYIILFGKYPFDAESVSQLNKKIIEEKQKYPKNVAVSKSCIVLIDKLLEKVPSFRASISDPAFDDWFNDNNIDFNENIDDELEDEKKEDEVNNENNDNLALVKKVTDDIDISNKSYPPRKKGSQMHNKLLNSHVNVYSPDLKRIQGQKRAINSYVSPIKSCTTVLNKAGNTTNGGKGAILKPMNK